MEISFSQNIDKAILVLRDAGRRLIESGKEPSKWWKLENLNKEFLLQYAKPEEFYVGMVEGQPAVAAVLPKEQTAQDWQNIDHGKIQPALYMHWLCVSRNFAGKGCVREMVEFATMLAQKEGINFLRVDTDADEDKLRKLYEDLGFCLVGAKAEDYRNTVFYQKEIICAQ